MTADPYKASAGANAPGSWNRYAYVEGDPVNYNDRAGLFASQSADPPPLPPAPAPVGFCYIDGQLVPEPPGGGNLCDVPSTVGGAGQTNGQVVGVSGAARNRFNAIRDKMIPMGVPTECEALVGKLQLGGNKMTFSNIKGYISTMVHASGTNSTNIIDTEVGKMSVMEYFRRNPKTNAAVPRATNDGKRVYWRDSWAESAPEADLAAEMMHEALHLAGLTDDYVGERFYGGKEEWAKAKQELGTDAISYKFMSECMK